MKHLLGILLLALIVSSCENQMPEIQSTGYDSFKNTTWSADSRTVKQSIGTSNGYVTVYRDTTYTEKIDFTIKFGAVQDAASTIEVQKYNANNTPNGAKTMLAGLTVSLLEVNRKELGKATAFTFYQSVNPSVNSTEFVRPYTYQQSGNSMTVSYTNFEGNHTLTYTYTLTKK